MNLNLIYRRPELNLQIYENNCFTNQQPIELDLNTKIININEHSLMFTNGTLYFILIVRHLIDGRQLITRLEVDRQINHIFDTTDLTVLEDAMNNLEDLALANPKKAVEFINGLAEKLNEMSDNFVSRII